MKLFNRTLLRRGFPYAHFYSVIPHMTLEQMSVKYLTAFEAYYGPDTQMGRALTLAQEEQFMNEGMGVPIKQ